MSSAQYAIDLAAPRREVQFPHGILVKFDEDTEFLFPAELPADALDPILSDDLDLVGFFGDLVQSQGRSAVGEVVELLFRRPRLPRLFMEAVRETYKILLGEQQFSAFIAARPSVPDYIRLTAGLVKVYGIDLGKLFGSADSSASDGETSKPTSAGTTGSTPEGSGSVPGTKGSSDSAD
ncbi:hypothetical protein GTY75_08695 [Streptomyces sp. SID8381]|uniref:hypothetical protein n=1 Tax=unclassified Streptomyces TaxID=2593676 RepID=UPI0003647CE9|nr:MULTISPECIES: hypothetical protein [unclassified Streptomyces]MYX26746.1 hypothetical protein [Streptomyces sp. SID8381]